MATFMLYVFYHNKKQVKRLEQYLPGVGYMRLHYSLLVFVLRVHILNLLPNSTPLLPSLQAAFPHPSLHPWAAEALLESYRGAAFRVLFT